MSMKTSSAHCATAPPEPTVNPLRLNPAYGRLSPVLMGAVVVVHGGLLFALLNPSPAPLAITLPRILTVSLIVPASAPVKREQPKSEKPKPLPPKAQNTVVRTPLPPVLAVERTAPSPAAIPSPPAPVPVQAAVEVEPQPVHESAPVAAPTPAPIVQPRFNAEYLDNPKPPYPALSRRLNEEGEVRLRVWVEIDGNATQVELARSSGFERLDRIALQTVRRWRFVPAQQGKQAVAAWVVVPISFNLRS